MNERRKMNRMDWIKQSNSLRIFTFTVFALMAGSFRLPGASPGDEVVVVYNRLMTESKGVAQYYAHCRKVPSEQVLGFDLPTSETITRAEYRELLQIPLLKALEKQHLFTFHSEIRPATSTEPGQVINRLVAAKIRYVVLCYGVPVRILRDTNLVEKGTEHVREELRRNEAAVDSELALLSVSKQGYPLFGPLGNPLYATTNSSWIHPTNNLLIVARLDGPSPSIARGLVDKAMEADTNGLWGRAYFDARGLTNGNYKSGDDWIRTAAALSRHLGFETILDDKPETFPASFPMSQIAIYAGWYDGNVSGPFTQPSVEFVPGAIAYHLHSFSAHSIRTPNQFWVGPLLEKGATATMGCVDEPYLEATPDLAVFFSRLFHGFTFGEAAYACQRVLSWQTTVVGDPLYQPFSDSPQQQHERLARRRSKLLEWSNLRAVNINAANGMPAAELIQFLERLSDTRESGVLTEKLGDLYLAQSRTSLAIRAYTSALQLKPTPQQRIRLSLELCQLLMQDGQESQAYEFLQKFLQDFPDYPDLLAVYQKLTLLAPKYGKPEDYHQYQRAIARLTPSSTK